MLFAVTHQNTIAAAGRPIPDVGDGRRAVLADHGSIKIDQMLLRCDAMGIVTGNARCPRFSGAMDGMVLKTQAAIKYGRFEMAFKAERAICRSIGNVIEIGQVSLEELMVG